MSVNTLDFKFFDKISMKSLLQHYGYFFAVVIVFIKTNRYYQSIRLIFDRTILKSMYRKTI